MSVPTILRLVGLVASVLAAAGCVSQTNDYPAPSSDPVRIPITLQDGTADPSGERIEVGVDQPIRLVVNSDTRDQIHVHSDPEHEFAVQPGQDQVFTFRIDRPGVYDVESHGLEVTIVQLEVR